MAIANGLIYLWSGTNAGIPAGFARETTLDTKYVRGSAAAVNPGGSGGQTTHTHTDSGHTPIQDSHLHTFSADEGFGSDLSDIGVSLALDVHIHASANSAAATGTNTSAVALYATAANEPAYLKVIFIKSSGGTATGIPDQAIAYADAAVPTGWTAYAALANSFPLGAAAGADAGGTGGSLGAHTHASGGSHTHLQNSHTHAATNSAAGTQVGGLSGTGSADHRFTHVHSVSFGSTNPTNNNTSPTLQSADGLPPWVKLLPMQNTSGASSFPDKHIALWLGTLALIPTDFALCDGTGGTTDTRSKFVNGAANAGEVGTTGGADTHTHTSDTCQPTQVAHTHTGTGAVGNKTRLLTAPVNFDANYALPTHTHNWTVGSTTATNQAKTITVNVNTSQTNYPPYIDVAYIKYTAPVVASAIISVATLIERHARIR